MWGSEIPSDSSGCRWAAVLHILRGSASMSPIPPHIPGRSFLFFSGTNAAEFLSPSASPSGRCCREVAEFRDFGVRPRLPRPESPPNPITGIPPPTGTILPQLGIGFVIPTPERTLAVGFRIFNGTSTPTFHGSERISDSALFGAGDKAAPRRRPPPTHFVGAIS